MTGLHAMNNEFGKALHHISNVHR